MSTITEAVTSTNVSGDPPSSLPKNFLKNVSKLDKLSAGHIRHFHNLASLPDGEWTYMGAQEPAQEWLDAYRYQLATMAYAAGTAHYHRLPALQSVFKRLIRSLIGKMLRREVWGYWYLTSQSGNRVDPDITELRRPWADPVKRENIMYSGHLLLMISLYAMLFDDHEFENEDSIVFHWNPVFYGMGPESFKYSRKSLQQAIIGEMERTSWMGACCEPNCVFVVCNQFPLIAMRYNDSTYGTNVIDEVLPKYKAAWEAKGMFAPNGLMVEFWRVKQDSKVPPRSLDSSAWAEAYMNTWDSTHIRAIYPNQIVGFLSSSDPGCYTLNPTPVAMTIRELVESEGADPNDNRTIEKARKIVAEQPQPPTAPYGYPSFGYAVKLLSEMGDEKLDGLLRHADKYMNPKWDKGGLYYSRNDAHFDANDNWIQVDPFTGNAAIGYARLNVNDGQKKMWDAPWTAKDIYSRPYVANIDLSSGVDFLRGTWVDELSALVLTLRTWDEHITSNVNPVINSLSTGEYAIYINGRLSKTITVDKSNDTVSLELRVDHNEMDVVIMKLGAVINFSH
ncbi:hypothetical protein F5884DRAFT_866626 [Xylogone sp. PMI_703]|nr:hypothetical protein F5884DRAFT_866626 [Xylogone sp. PMI_703]